MMHADLSAKDTCLKARFATAQHCGIASEDTLKPQIVGLRAVARRVA